MQNISTDSGKSLQSRYRFILLVNLLTVSRLFAGIGSVALYYSPILHAYLPIAFSYILASDLLDGFLARQLHSTTRLGGLLDYVIDRFNYYLIIAVLIHEGISPLIFLPWFLRDLLYITVQAYTTIPRIRGTKALSFAGTIATYIYVLYLNQGGSPALNLTLILLTTLFTSLVNMVVRVVRLREELVRSFAEDVLS